MPAENRAMHDFPPLDPVISKNPMAATTADDGGLVRRSLGEGGSPHTQTHYILSLLNSQMIF